MHGYITTLEKDHKTDHKTSNPWTILKLKSANQKNELD